MAYSQISSHRSMVFDEHRNELYARAIRELVTPGSVVLDLGAGLGILGMIAAKAGAKRVYLVEPEPVVQIAMEVAKANGLADRVVVMEGKIEEVELPEKVDLIISVFTGNLLYSEDLLPSLFYARDRYLKPGGNLIPDFAELHIAPISSPDPHAKYIERWSEKNFGLDFSAARRFAGNEILWFRREDLVADKLGAGVVLASVDLMSATRADCQGKVHCQIEKSGICHGLLSWIRIRLGGKWLSSDPAGPEVHWSPVVLPLDPPLEVGQSEEIEIDLRRPAHGDWTWAVKAASGTRRHSSFLARVDAKRRLRKMAPDNRAGIGKSGENVLHVLAMMQAGKNNKEIAQSLFDDEHQSFQNIDDALQFVQGLAMRYGK